MLYTVKHCNGNLYFRQGAHSSKYGMMYHQVKSHWLHSFLVKYAIFYFPFMFQQDVVMQIHCIEDLKFKAQKNILEARADRFNSVLENIKS